MPVKDHWHRMVHSRPGLPADNSTSDASTRTSSESSSAKTSSKASSKTSKSSQASASAHANFLAAALHWRSRKPPRLPDGLGDDGKKKKKRSSADDDELRAAFRAYRLEFGATRPRRPSRDGDISPGTTRPPSLRETSG